MKEDKYQKQLKQAVLTIATAPKDKNDTGGQLYFLELG